MKKLEKNIKNIKIRKTIITISRGVHNKDNSKKGKQKMNTTTEKNWKNEKKIEILISKSIRVHRTDDKKVKKTENGTK